MSFKRVSDSGSEVRYGPTTMELKIINASSECSAMAGMP